MPPTGDSFTTLNLPPTINLPDCMDYFSLTAGPNTNLWRKPPTGDIATAPIVFTSLRNRFTMAEVTVSADWEMEWDQGGLVIFTGPTPEALELSTTTRTATYSDRHRTRTTGTRIPRLQQQAGSRACKWVKAGMEYTAGAAHASSVSATADGADWCAAPLTNIQQTGDQMPSTSFHSLRIKLERVGYSLWIWYQEQSPSPYAMEPEEMMWSWKKLREVSWFFYGVDNKFVHVGAYASRPYSPSSTWPGSTGDEDDGLEVEFDDLEIF